MDQQPPMKPAAAVWVLHNVTTPVTRRNYGVIETVSPEGTFCDTIQVPSGAGDMELL